MNKTRFRLLVFLMSLSLVGIIIVQLYWINTSLKKSEEEFKLHVPRVWTETDLARQRRLPFHLVNAASHLFFLHLAKTHEKLPSGAAAVVDAQGRFHESQPRFLDFLDRHFPGRSDPQTLPFDLPPPGTQHMINNALCVRCESMGDLWVLHLWPAGPLDRLTAREREIVLAVSQGLSFKQAARKIGIAPSTVANHLYRIYRKLDVYSRTELALLVYPESPPDETDAPRTVMGPLSPAH